MFSIQKDGSLVELREQPYDNEDVFQAMLAKYPSLLAGEQITPHDPRRWLLVTREAGIPDDEFSGNRWSVDHLFLDQDAIPTLVEVKRSTDTRIRREVLGQVLEYAANATVFWPLDTIRAKFEAYCNVNDIDPDDAMRQFLNGGDSEEFWQRAYTNLQAGKVRLLFVADVIPNELRRIVEFLNMQMRPAEVLAVEIKQFVGEGIQTLVPRVIGQTAQAEQKKRTTTISQMWTEEDVIQALQERSPQEAETAQKILDWAHSKRLKIISGKGGKTGTMFLSTDGKSKDLFGINTSGTMPIMLGNLKAPYDTLDGKERLIGLLNETLGTNFTITDAKRSFLDVRLGGFQEDVLQKFLKNFMS